jgi:hypothetical protein
MNMPTIRRPRWHARNINGHTLETIQAKTTLELAENSLFRHTPLTEEAREYLLTRANKLGFHARFIRHPGREYAFAGILIFPGHYHWNDPLTINPRIVLSTKPRVVMSLKRNSLIFIEGEPIRDWFIDREANLLDLVTRHLDEKAAEAEAEAQHSPEDVAAFRDV